MMTAQMNRVSLRSLEMATGSLNKVCLIGNLGTDPQIRRTTNGKLAAILNVMTSDYWRPGTARVQWHRVVIFNERLAEFAERQLKKGSKIYVEGTLETRKWFGKDGKSETWTSEVIVSGFHGRLIILDDVEPRDELLADDTDMSPAPPAPPSPSNQPDAVDSGLHRFLAD